MKVGFFLVGTKRNIIYRNNDAMINSCDLADTFGRTENIGQRHTKVIPTLHTFAGWKVKGEEEEYMRAFMHQQTDPEADQSAELCIASGLHYFTEHFMPSARIHLILTNL